jgi:hypothetical protein
MVKYVIKRAAPAEVDKVKMSLMSHSEIELKGGGAVVTTTRLSPESSIAWPSNSKRDRLVVIVLRVETDSGAWVIDASDQMEAISEAVKQGEGAKLRARFIPK